MRIEYFRMLQLDVLILKMNFNFKFKDILLRRGSQSATA